MRNPNLLRYLYKTLTVILFALVTVDMAVAQVTVKGYYRKDGTYVKSHQRTKPDSNPYNNYSYPGNYNPNTGKVTTGNPSTYLKNYNNRSTSSSNNKVWVESYYRSDGTFVKGHYRTKPDGNLRNNYSYPGNSSKSITSGNSSYSTTSKLSNPSSTNGTSSHSYSRERNSKKNSTFYYSYLNEIYSKEEVKELQRNLKILGFDPGQIDGVIGPRTHRAVEQFNQKYNN